LIWLFWAFGLEALYFGLVSSIIIPQGMSGVSRLHIRAFWYYLDTRARVRRSLGYSIYAFITQ
jgi:hypothetical protein